MASSSKAPRPRAGTVSGASWGERPGDRATIREAQFRQACDEVLYRLALTRGARLCDAICGAGAARDRQAAPARRRLSLDAGAGPNQAADPRR